ncbi:MAG: alpha/beta fold hydrolase [Spirochaetales bacterium]|jgi:pimeloyl-ACP methyl ester carboxylesterase|nr:alpha/beta fold hydrolase [Spirochaetales bacterium]
MILHFDPPAEGPEGRPAFFFLHGFLGAGSNWRSLAKVFAQDYLVVCPDAINHGRSPRRREVSYPAMAQDLFDTASSLGRETFVALGHSMGGKTVMEAALSRPDRVKALIVADIAPRSYPPAFAPYLEALLSLNPREFKTRKEGMDALESAIPDRSLRSFLLNNLERTEEGFDWRINLSALSEGYDEIRGGVEGGRVYTGPALFLKGENSSYIEPGDETFIKSLFPLSRQAVIRGAGHWLQADNPGETAEAIRAFLEEI